jgi:hypothetical protein
LRLQIQPIHKERRHLAQLQVSEYLLALRVLKAEHLGEDLVNANALYLQQCFQAAEDHIYLWVISLHVKSRLHGRLLLTHELRLERGNAAQV